MGTYPTILLPHLHAGQRAAMQIPGRRKVVRCGRRFGKSMLAKCIATKGVTEGEYIGYFTPKYKYQAEIYAELVEILAPITKSASKIDGVIRTIGGGRIDFWTLEDESAGRSRKYHQALMDEVAFTKNNMRDIWERSIEPTLLDYGGTAWALSNTNGSDPQNFMWQICNDPKLGFKEYHAPSWDNPVIPTRIPGESKLEWLARRDETFADLRAKKPPLVFAQEYGAEFVDWSGAAFFKEDYFLVDGKPVDYPEYPDYVFAVVDTATKTGKHHDGTAVLYCSFNPRTPHKLTFLDWDIFQIEGSLLEVWLPTVFQRLEDLARQTKARYGSMGAHIEDKASGMVLLQQSARRGWPAHGIDSKLTALGKDERAISTSGYAFQGLAKISHFAHAKRAIYKEQEKNHFLSQVTGFRVGVDQGDDDCLDTMCYALIITLGDRDGF